MSMRNFRVIQPREIFFIRFLMPIQVCIGRSTLRYFMFILIHFLEKPGLQEKYYPIAGDVMVTAVVDMIMDAMEAAAGVVIQPLLEGVLVMIVDMMAVVPVMMEETIQEAVRVQEEMEDRVDPVDRVVREPSVELDKSLQLKYMMFQRQVALETELPGNGLIRMILQLLLLPMKIIFFHGPIYVKKVF
jgi:hypothetical protein